MWLLVAEAIIWHGLYILFFFVLSKILVMTKNNFGKYSYLLHCSKFLFIICFVLWLFKLLFDSFVALSKRDGLGGKMVLIFCYPPISNLSY